MGVDGTTGLDLRNDQLAVVTAVQPDGLGGVFVGDRDGECPAPQSFEFWHALRAEHVPAPNDG